MQLRIQCACTCQCLKPQTENENWHLWQPISVQQLHSTLHREEANSHPLAAMDLLSQTVAFAVTLHFPASVQSVHTHKIKNATQQPILNELAT